MNVTIWMLAGAALGWIGISYMQYNETRGTLVSMLMGAMGALFGGKVIAPMFLAAAAAPADFSLAALIWALLIATGVLALGNQVYERYGV